MVIRGCSPCRAVQLRSMSTMSQPNSQPYYPGGWHPTCAFYVGKAPKSVFETALWLQAEGMVGPTTWKI